MLRKSGQAQCPQECLQSFYNNKITLESDTREDKEKFIMSDGIINIIISRNDQPNMFIEYMAETTFISFICNFGGLLGMWLGVSILSISQDLFEFTKFIIIKLSLAKIKFVINNPLIKIRNPQILISSNRLTRNQ